MSAGELWRVKSSSLFLGGKGWISLEKDDLIFVCSDLVAKNHSVILTRHGLANVFWSWQKYCVRVK